MLEVAYVARLVVHVLLSRYFYTLTVASFLQVCQSDIAGIPVDLYASNQGVHFKLLFLI